MAPSPSPALTELKDHVCEVLSGIQFDNAASIMGFFAGLPALFEGLAEDFTGIVARVEEAPVNDPPAEELKEFAATIGGLSAVAQEVADKFYASHEDDIRRHEEPRRNEPAWNVDPGGDD